MTEGKSSAHPNGGHMIRSFGLLQAVALNMSNMIGVGPFITIPLMLAVMGGPQAILGWILGLILVFADGMVWAELGAAMPGSGGTFLYLLEGFGRKKYGQLLAFLFIWQFILSGPLEIASGIIGFSMYAGYLWKGMTPLQAKLLSMGVGVFAIFSLYRKITSIGKLTVILWAGTILTVLWVIVSGALNFKPAQAFSFPPNAFNLSPAFFTGLGAASLIAVYNFLGYYDICYIGSEVRNPGRTIPRSIIYSVLAVAVIYLAIYVLIIGVVPWQQAMNSKFIVSDFMEQLYGPTIAAVVTIMILWTAFGSIFALILGYSRIPYAAAVEGYFFSIFARLHPKKNFPHISLLVVGLVSVAASLVDLSTVIIALMTTRILIQFIGQIAALVLLRRNRPDLPRPFRMWLYPLPCAVALVGWSYVFLTSGWRFIFFGLGTVVTGVVVFFIWTRFREPKRSSQLI
jgi:amino acid transporter